MNVQNSSGTILYGMHFYPGLAQYNQPNNESFKIFLNEDTLRKMDASFAGKPIFVEHVDEVESNLDELRKESDGWVVESFYNAIDGKHWVKMIIVSDKAERAIKNGFRLSNAYVPKLNGRSGEWNGIAYQNEVVDGEYEHLAIVKHPRYEESVIMTPEEFKLYNENLQIELKRIANSNFKESDHPRAADGKFGSGGGSSGGASGGGSSESSSESKPSTRPSSREKKTKEAVVGLVSGLLKEKDFPPAHKEKIKSVLSLFKEGKVDAGEVSFRVKQAGYHSTADIISPKKSVENNLNSSTKEINVMSKLKFWNKKPVENTVDFENLSVSLPKSGREFTIYQIVNEMDEMEEKKKENMADPEMKVKLHDGKMCNVGELVEKYKDMSEKMAEKKENEEMDTETGLAPETSDIDVEGDLQNEDEEEEAEEEEKKKELKNKKMKNKEETEEEEEKKEKMQNEKAKKRENFETLKNAHLNAKTAEMKYDSADDKLSRGRSKYGS